MWVFKVRFIAWFVWFGLIVGVCSSSFLLFLIVVFATHACACTPSPTPLRHTHTLTHTHTHTHRKQTFHYKMHANFFLDHWLDPSCPDLPVPSVGPRASQLTCCLSRGYRHRPSCRGKSSRWPLFPAFSYCVVLCEGRWNRIPSQVGGVGCFSLLGKADSTKRIHNAQMRNLDMFLCSSSSSSSSSSSNCILMSCQPLKVTSGQSNSGHKQIHISKLFSHIFLV